MADESPARKRMPLWSLCGIVLLFALAGFGLGVEVGRDVAIARPEFAAGLSRYTQPLILGCLAGVVALCVWPRCPRGHA